MSELVFQPFPKMARLTRECVITEKIDGTNAQVFIVHSLAPEPGAIAHKSLGDAGDLSTFAGSRTRYITPDADNMGFAAWVKANAEQLWALGPGRHFGEWWESKIQRGYGQPGGTKHFSLFNTSRWAQLPEGEPFDYMLDGPILGTGLLPCRPRTVSRHVQRADGRRRADDAAVARVEGRAGVRGPGRHSHLPHPRGHPVQEDARQRRGAEVEGRGVTQRRLFWSVLVIVNFATLVVHPNPLTFIVYIYCLVGLLGGL